MNLRKDTKQLFALSLVAACIALFSSIALLTTSAFLLTLASLQPGITPLHIPIAIVRLAALSRGLFRYLEQNCGHSAVLSWVASLRKVFFLKRAAMPAEWILQRSSAEDVTKALEDSERFERAMFTLPSSFVTQLFLIPVSGLFFFTLKPVLFFLPFLLVSVIYLFAKALGVFYKRKAIQQIELQEKEEQILQESMDSADELGGFQRIEQWHQDLFETASLRNKVQFKKEKLRFLSLFLSFFILIAPAILLVSFITFRQHDSGLITLPWVAAYCFATIFVLSPLRLVPASLFEKIDCEILFSRLAPETHDKSENGDSFTNTTQLNFQNFRVYHPGAETPSITLPDFNLSVGESVSVCGPSGSGKSSLANALCGFLRHSGDIVLDNRPVGKLPDAKSQTLFARCEQHPLLLSGSLRENLRLFNESATDEEMLKALSLSECGFANDLNLLIGEGGKTLSGGEKRRLAVARTLLSKRPFFIFDEATTGLPSEQGSAIYKNILAGCPDKGIIWITHNQYEAEKTTRRVVLSVAC